MRPYVAWIAPLILAMASSRGSTPEIAKKQVCMIVLMRPGHARVARPPHRRRSRRDGCACESSPPACARGSSSHTRSGPNGLLRRNTAPSTASRSMSTWSHELELVTGHEAGTLHEVGGPNRPRPEPQVRRRPRSRLLRVVDEEALRVPGRLFADDLDRVLVRPNSSVRAKAVEHAADDVLSLG